MAAAEPVTALAGETLDALVWRVSGSSKVEQVLAANRGLAELGAFLPEGHVVLVPAAAIAPAAELALIQLWD